MPALVLYHFPGTCARVTLTALEQTGFPYETHLVRFFLGEHKQPAYLAINPQGKVPTLVVDGRPLTETAAIARYLTRIAPDAALMPTPEDPLADALAWSDLVWCAATISPIVTRLRMAHIFAGPDHAGLVWTMADEALSTHLRIAEERLRGQPWMLGEDWSLVDTYLFWIWDTVVGADVDPAPYPAIAAHAERNRQHPATARALALEGEAFAGFAAEGHTFSMPPSAKPRP